MTIWVIVLSLAALPGASGVPILPKERPQGFLTKQECVAQIPSMRRRWDGLSLPAIEKATCEILEMPK